VLTESVTDTQKNDKTENNPPCYAIAAASGKHVSILVKAVRKELLYWCCYGTAD